MAWSNKASRERLSVEKSHTLSIAVRVEDRLHRDVLRTTDKILFTVRADSYKVSPDDTDARITIEASDASDSLGASKIIVVQASQLNLDPELEYFYDITYIRDAFSLSLASGEFEVAPNVTNRGHASTFVPDALNQQWNLVATLQGKMLLNVTRNFPMAEKGSPGVGTYIAHTAFPLGIGTSTEIPAGQIDTFDRELQVGDILFSSVTKGVMAVVRTITITTGVVAVSADVVQVYGQEPLKALMDTVTRPESRIAPDTMWAIPRGNVPLPPGYEHHVGDFVFSQCADAGKLDKYLVLSLVQAVTPVDLTVQTKLVYPMFSDLDVLQNLLDAKVDKTQKINGVALNSNEVSMNADKVPDGATKVVMTSAERTKLAGVATGATANSTDASLRDRANHTGAQSISTVTGLQSSLNLRPVSNTVTEIWRGTQAMYDQIVTPNPNTLYFITVA